MSSISKNNLRLIIIIGIIVILCLGFLFYPRNPNKQNGQNNSNNYDYVSLFRDNKDMFVELAKKLDEEESDIKIINKSGIAVIKSDQTYKLSEYSFDKGINEEIEFAFKEFNIREITKSLGKVEFMFDSEKDRCSIVYAENKDVLNNYTEIKNLGDNFYYCFIFNE